MGRLYPRMRERPPEFRINPESPLYCDLRALYLLTPLSSRLWNAGTNTYAVNANYYTGPEYSWSDTLNRPAIRFNTTTHTQPRGYIQSQLYVRSGSGYTYAAWVFGRAGLGARSVVLWCPTSFLSLEHYPVGKVRYVLQVSPYSSAAAPITLNTWEHFTGTYDYSNIKLWKNGIVAEQTARTQSLPSTYGDMYIGCANMSDSFGWVGSLADCAVWSRPLSAAEIAALADPSNVDLRVGGVPLILPPRRRFFPSVEIHAPTFNPAWAQHVNTYIGLGR